MRTKKSAAAKQPPASGAVRVVRAWPGVHNGQVLVVPHARRERLMRSGFVKEVADEA